MMNFKHSQDELPLKPMKTFTNVDTSMKLVKFPQPPENPLEMISSFHGIMGTDSEQNCPERSILMPLSGFSFP